MTTIQRFVTLATLALALPARAHLAPIDPSTCAIDIALSAPDAGLTATVDPPAAGDLLRFSYEPDTSPAQSRVQACPADPVEPSARCSQVAVPVPRDFEVGGVSGTIAVPSAFTLRMLSSGDLDTTNVPIPIAMGTGPIAVPFTLTTGVVLVGGAPVVGSPIGARGAMRLVGTGASAALPPPLGGAQLLLQLSCVPSPIPDLDQFAPAPRLTKVRGALGAKKAKLVMMLESELGLTADPAGVPTVLQLVGGGQTLLEQVMTLQAGPRGRFVSGGGELTVIPLRRKGVRAQKLIFRKAGQATSFGSGDGTIVVETGGLLARRGVKLTAKGGGNRLAVRER